MLFHEPEHANYRSMGLRGEIVHVLPSSGYGLETNVGQYQPVIVKRSFSHQSTKRVLLYRGASRVAVLFELQFSERTIAKQAIHQIVFSSFTCTRSIV